MFITTGCLYRRALGQPRDRHRTTPIRYLGSRCTGGCLWPRPGFPPVILLVFRGTQKNLSHLFMNLDQPIDLTGHELSPFHHRDIIYIKFHSIAHLMWYRYAIANGQRTFATGIRKWSRRLDDFPTVHDPRLHPTVALYPHGHIHLFVCHCAGKHGTTSIHTTVLITMGECTEWSWHLSARWSCQCW